MLRKQLYLSRDQDRKLKRLASRRGVTEAEIVRQAIDRLPEGEDALITDLRAAGLLVAKPPLPEHMQGKDPDALEAELWKQLGDLDGATLGEAVLREREESRY